MPKAVSRDALSEATKQDRTLFNVSRAIRDGRWFEIIGDDPDAKSLHTLRSDLAVSSDGIILRGHRIVMPRSLRLQCIKLAHAGHQGIVKTKNLLRSKVWFSGMDQMVEDEIKGCLACQSATPKSSRQPLAMTDIPLNRWERLSMDFCGPMSTGEYLMV